MKVLPALLFLVAVVHLCSGGTPPASTDCPPGAPVCPAYCGSSHSIPPLSAAAAQNWTLAQIQVIIRHGARAPISFDGSCFAKQVDSAFNCSVLQTMQAPSVSPDSSELEVNRLFRSVFLGGNYSDSAASEVLRGTCPNGELLLEGYLQEQNNGQMLNAAYVGPGKLFPTGTTPSTQEMYMVSTDNMRCLTSGSAVINNMFPLSASGTNQLQVLNFHVTDSDNDVLVGSNCALFRDMINQNTVFALDPTKCISEQKAVNATVLSLINSLDKSPSNTWDCVMCYGCTGLEMPPQFTPEMSLLLAGQGSTLGTCMYNDPRVRTMAAGALLQDIVTRMQSTVAGGPLKFVFYSAHDVTLMPVLSAMGALVPGPSSWPPYASLMSIELYQNNNNATQFGVRVVYNGNETPVAGCPGEVCDFASFANVLSQSFLTPGLCDVPPPSPAPLFDFTGEDKTVVIGLGVAFVVSTVWAVTVTVLLCRKKRSRDIRMERLL